MALEIERKFLLANESWRNEAISSSTICQGYLTAAGTTVRVRLRDDRAYLTIKGKPAGLCRSEFEYPIPVADAREMLGTLALDPPVEKIRYIVPAGNGLFWEIDEYLGVNAPLFTAELEIPDENTPFERPQWLGREISGDSRYTNRALSRRPFSLWGAEEL